MRGPSPHLSVDRVRIFAWTKSAFWCGSVNHATSTKFYRSYYPHRSRELVSPICRIFFLKFCQQMGYDLQSFLLLNSLLQTSVFVKFVTNSMSLGTVHYKGLHCLDLSFLQHCLTFPQCLIGEYFTVCSVQCTVYTVVMCSLKRWCTVCTA